MGLNNGPFQDKTMLDRSAPSDLFFTFKLFSENIFYSFSQDSLDSILFIICLFFVTLPRTEFSGTSSGVSTSFGSDKLQEGLLVVGSSELDQVWDNWIVRGPTEMDRLSL